MSSNTREHVLTSPNAQWAFLFGAPTSPIAGQDEPMHHHDKASRNALACYWEAAADGIITKGPCNVKSASGGR